MTTNEKGNIGLAKVIADLTEKGYQCFLPLTDTTLIDLIVVNKQLGTKTLQIKYKKLNKAGSIEINKASSVNGKWVIKDTTGIDIYGVYCPDNKKLYYVSTKDMITSTFTINIMAGGQPNLNSLGKFDITKTW